MNAIRQTQQLNRRELENVTPPSASWHADYKDTAWIYVGGFPLDLSEGDVITIFSQFGNPTHLNLIRDRETGKSKGFGFLKYEDQRSCDLAVDNLTGAEVLGRMLRVDHTRYKKRDDEDEDTYRIERLEAELEAEKNGSVKRASDTEDEHESEDEMRRRKRRKQVEGKDKLAIKENGEHEEDPMKSYLRDEKHRERERDHEREHKHNHRRRHRNEEADDGEPRAHKRHHRDDDRDTSGRETRSHGDHGDRSRETQPERRERRTKYRSDESSNEGGRRSSRHERASPNRRRRRSRSRSDDNKPSNRGHSFSKPADQGRSSKPGRLKFKGDD